ncbi:MAG TPA: hyalin, partial [Candidatus Dojkabacteria bacterium]|nr:hyalin [Candidatus Dojkabacteria bacterium]
DILIFAADNGINGTELWRSDGTEAGTVMVKDIYPGVDGSLYSEYGLTLMGDYLYFRAEDDTHGIEL